MKTLKIVLAAALVAALTLAVQSSPSSAAGAGPDTLTITEPVPPATYEVGQSIKVLMNINEDGGEVFASKLQVSPNGTDSWTDVPGQSGTTTEYGRITFTFSPTGDQYLRGTWSNGTRETEHLHLTPIVPVPQTGVLNDPTNSGKNWTADFTPGQADKAVQLQYQQIYTDETDEVDATNPGDSKTKKMGPWKTIATAKQNAAGHVTFPTLASPYPYRVDHKYRAVSGAAKTCDPINATDAATNTCKVFGIPNPTTSYDTGLSKVTFNTNEGHAIDTRTRYYEGEFKMTTGTPGCNADIAPMKFSTMKGRGNYSWSFNRQSYTLKLGSSTDLCGMGKSKKWALVSQDFDKSFLRNALAGYVGSKLTNLAFTPKSKPVDLYLNGKYRGNYLLIERIAIQKAPDRLAIDELKGGEKCNDVATPDDQSLASHPNNTTPCITGGYILEWDFRKGADYNPYLGSDSGYVGVKDPENDRDRANQVTKKGISSYQKSYIKGYLEDADAALRASSCTSSSWTNYFDVASAVDYYIGMEYMKPVDGKMWASVYMYKPRNGKLFFGPMWDFDLGAGSADRAGGAVSSSGFYIRNNNAKSSSAKDLKAAAQQSTTTWFNCLNKRASFRQAVADRWDEVKDSIQPTQFIDEQKAIIATSANRSFASSPSSHSYRIVSYQVIKSDWAADVANLRSWASARKSWLSGSSGF